MVDRDYKFFNAASTEEALRKCVVAGYTPLFLPELLRKRMDDPVSDLWQRDIDTLSLRVTGKSKAGNPVVIYAHMPHYFMDPQQLASRPYKDGELTAEEIMIEKDFFGNDDLLYFPLQENNVRTPYNEFLRLLELEDNKKVWVYDFNKFTGTPKFLEELFDILTIEQFLQHPGMKASLGLRENELEKYVGLHNSCVTDPKLQGKILFNNPKSGKFISEKEDSKHLEEAYSRFLKISSKNKIKIDAVVSSGYTPGHCDLDALPETTVCFVGVKK